MGKQPNPWAEQPVGTEEHPNPQRKQPNGEGEQPSPVEPTMPWLDIEKED